MNAEVSEFQIPKRGYFAKGDDPRRPQGLKFYEGMTIAQMCRLRGPKCVEFWERVMDDEQVPWPVRVRASELLMERGHGKAKESIELTTRPSEQMTDDEIVAVLAQVRRMPITYQGEASDASFTASDVAPVNQTDAT